MSPEASRDSAPEGCQEAVFPIDDSDVLVMVDGEDDFFGYFLGLEHHRVMEIATEQGRVNKAGTDVGESDVQSSCVSLLF